MILSNLINNHHPRLLGLIIFFFTGLIILYFRSAKSLFELWMVSGNPAYSHGPILFSIAVYAFLKRFKFAPVKIDLNNSISGFVVLSATSFLWGGVVLAGIKVGHQFLFLMMIPIGLWFLFGLKASRHLSLPFLLILFAIPVWEVINQGHLQSMVAFFVTKLLELSGFLVYREGFDITVTAGSFRVAENCSGMRQLLVAMPLAIIFSYINQLTLKRSIILFCLSVVLAVITNLIRIYIVVVSGQLTKMQHYFVTEDHVTLGWVLFAIIFFVFFMVSKKYFEKENAEKKELVRDEVMHKNSQVANTRVIRAALFLLTGMLAGPVYIHYALSTAYSFNKNVNIEVNSGWVMHKNNLNYTPDLLPADLVYRQNFIKDNDSVTLYVNYYAVQAEGKEAVSNLNKLHDKHNKWLLKSKAASQFEFDADSKITVNVFLLENDIGQKKYIWQWYFLGGQHTNRFSYAKMLGVRGAFLNDTGASMIILVTDVKTDIREAGRVLENFAVGSILPITEALKKKIRG